MGTHRFGLRARWVALLEALYAPEPDDRAWGAAVVDASDRIFGIPDHSGVTIVTHPAPAETIELELAVGMAEREAAFINEYRALGFDTIRKFFYPPTMVNTHGALLRDASEKVREVVRLGHAHYGTADAIGLIAHPAPGLVAVLYHFAPARVTLGREERRLLAQATLHFETACRLRRGTANVIGEVLPDGRVIDLREASGARLRHRVQLMERARTRRHRNEPDAIDLWSALLEGRFSLVERTHGARRTYLVVDNPPARTALRALTPGEVETLAQASRGLSAKMIAYALGVSQATVSQRLASAASKVGAATRTELVRIAALLARDPRAGFDAELTSAERSVLELVLRGLSNREIAHLRQRSVRTIANQVASLLRKTGSPSRRALSARLP